MGYDQDVYITFKDGDIKALRILLGLKCPEFDLLLKSHEESYINESDSGKELKELHFSLSGKNLYEENGILLYDDDGEKQIDLKELSKQLDCDIEIEYYGEDRTDAEQILVKKGVKTEHRRLEWSDIVM